MTKQTKILIGLAGIAAVYLLLKKKPATVSTPKVVVCEDGTPGDGTARPCLNHGGIAVSGTSGASTSGSSGTATSGATGTVRDLVIESAVAGSTAGAGTVSAPIVTATAGTGGGGGTQDSPMAAINQDAHFQSVPKTIQHMMSYTPGGYYDPTIKQTSIF